MSDEACRKMLYGGKYNIYPLVISVVTVAVIVYSKDSQYYPADNTNTPKTEIDEDNYVHKQGSSHNQDDIVIYEFAEEYNGIYNVLKRIILFSHVLYLRIKRIIKKVANQLQIKPVN